MKRRRLKNKIKSCNNPEKQEDGNRYKYKTKTRRKTNG
jgi:hypothetical protein